MKSIFASLLLLFIGTQLRADAAATITSTEGWSVTVILRYSGMTLTSNSNDCRYGFSYHQNYTYEVLYSDGGGPRSYYIGIGGGCITDGGTVGVPETTSLTGTLQSPNKYSNTATQCNQVDPDDYFCETMNLTISGPGISEQTVSMQYLDGNATLPLSLTDLLATEERAGIRIEWLIEGEQEQAHYTVERSPDGVHWTGIVSLPGRTDITYVNDYSFLDLAPLAGTSYYRIAVISPEGNRSFSNVVFLDRGRARQQLSPNPVHDLLTLRGFDDLRIISMDGKDLTASLNVRDEGHGNYTLDVSGLKRGLYIARSPSGSQRFERL